MRALILKNKNKLSIEERELATLSDFDVLIKVEVACVCGSDFRLLNQNKIHDIVLGHEFSGTVLRSGKGVKEKLVGKRVTVFPMFSCLDCDSCKSERHRDCDNKISLGWDLDGAFANEVVVDSRFVIELPDDISFAEGALVEHLSCGYRVAQEILNTGVAKDTPIAIFGDGPIGLSNILFLKLLDFNNISVIGRYDSRLKLACEFGAKRVTKDIQTIHNSEMLVVSAPNGSDLLELISRNPIHYIVPQTRIKEKTVLNEILRRNIKMGRGFAYVKDDFYQVINFLQGNRVLSKKMLSREMTIYEFANEVNFSSLKKPEYKIFFRPNKNYGNGLELHRA